MVFGCFSFGRVQFTFRRFPQPLFSHLSSQSNAFQMFFWASALFFRTWAGLRNTTLVNDSLLTVEVVLLCLSIFFFSHLNILLQWQIQGCNTVQLQETVITPQFLQRWTFSGSYFFAVVLFEVFPNWSEWREWTRLLDFPALWIQTTSAHFQLENLFELQTDHKTFSSDPCISSQFLNYHILPGMLFIDSCRVFFRSFVLQLLQLPHLPLLTHNLYLYQVWDQLVPYITHMTPGQLLICSVYSRE